MDIAAQNQPITPNVTVPNSVPVQEPTQFKIPEPSSGSKMPLYFLVLVSLVVVLAAGIYLGKTYFYPSAKQNSRISVTPTSVVSTPTSTEATSGAEMANWKTYKNEKYGFEFKYPAEWQIETKDFNGFERFVINSQVLIDVMKNKYNSVLNDYQENYTIDGIRGYKFKSDSITDGLAFHRDDNYFIVFTSSNDSNVLQIFDQILSTFKFTEKKNLSPTVSIGARMSYKSSLGFEINYPKDWLLKDNILYSYDPGDYQGQKPIPDKIVKCDFISGNDLSAVNVISQNDVQLNNPKIVKMQVEYKNPGMISGDTRYVFEQNSKAVSLICYFFDPSFQSTFNEIITTFKFL